MDRPAVAAVQNLDTNYQLQHRAPQYARRTSQEPQEKLHIDLGQRTIEERSNDIVNKDASDNLKVVELREEYDQIEAFFSSRFFCLLRIKIAW